MSGGAEAAGRLDCIFVNAGIGGAPSARSSIAGRKTGTSLSVSWSAAPSRASSTCPRACRPKAGGGASINTASVAGVTGVCPPVDGGLTSLGVDIRRTMGRDEAAASPLAGITAIDYGCTGAPPKIRPGSSRFER